MASLPLISLYYYSGSEIQSIVPVLLTKESRLHLLLCLRSPPGDQGNATNEQNDCNHERQAHYLHPADCRACVNILHAGRAAAAFGWTVGKALVVRLPIEALVENVT
jgi:hypothetical protein